MTAPSNANTSGLEACPFCGGEAWLNAYEAKYSDLPPKSRCPQCRSCGASLGYLATPAKATEAWNRRVTTASAQARIAELEAEVEAHRSGAWILAETKRAQAAEARVAELEAVKWEAQHADTMNDLVAMGLARDAAEARADRLADGITAAMLILTPEPGDKSLTEREKTARQLLAALQDQPK